MCAKMYNLLLHGTLLLLHRWNNVAVVVRQTDRQKHTQFYQFEKQNNYIPIAPHDSQKKCIFKKCVIDEYTFHCISNVKKKLQ